jgi:hypothetical protein
MLQSLSLRTTPSLRKVTPMRGPDRFMVSGARRGSGSWARSGTEVVRKP